MKESIGGTQLFILVITLVLIFAGIMAFTINRSNAFAIKDQLVTIIEEAGKFDMNYGSNDEVINQIVASLEHNSYRQTGQCPETTTNRKVLAFQRDGSMAMGNNDASFCIARIDGNSPAGTPPKYYYQIIVFYSLDLPVLDSIFNFKAIGETKALYS